VTARIGVIDHGSGNIHSVCQALVSAGATVTLSSRHTELELCDGFVLPGVGAFAACMDGLRAIDGVTFVRAMVAAGRPLLGVCVGHQMLFERGVEHGVETEGLGLLPGVVDRLTARRLPHMGWNTVDATPGDMFAGIAGQRFYFVHSYAVHETSAQPGVAWCEHDGDRFVAAIAVGAVWGTQFHPEKSGAAGARLLSNWLGRVAAAN